MKKRLKRMERMLGTIGRAMALPGLQSWCVLEERPQNEATEKAPNVRIIGPFASMKEALSYAKEYDEIHYPDQEGKCSVIEMVQGTPQWELGQPPKKERKRKDREPVERW